MGASDLWYKNAVIYALDVETFQDSDGDGVGDFPGLIDRLDYLQRLGVDCLWLLPFYPSPNRDNGYDVVDYYDVDPRFGTLGDFVEFVHEAKARGIKVIVDLVVNHTSNEHPWFQQAREDPDSKYRDYYVWTDDPPERDPTRGPVFPGEQEDVWTYDEVADAYYFHRFYYYQPDLNVANPEVREEIRKIMGFWLQLGVSGFRVDAATLMIDQKGLPGNRPESPHQVLKDMRAFTARRGGDAVLLAEADDDPHELATYFGEGDEMNLLMNFLLDAYLVAALATEDGEPIEQVLEILPDLPEAGQWANFLRNHDELNLGRLPTQLRERAFDAFAPDKEMRIFGRGIRRRLAPMLEGDRDRIEMAFSLLFSMPGTPLFVYGDEIGMGEDLDLPGRDAVRTPMQWTDSPNGGFSTAPEDELTRPVIDDGPFAFDEVNVADQRGDPDSMLTFVERLIGTRKECSEIGWGECGVVETDEPSVFAHRCRQDERAVLAVHNLADDPATATLDLDEYAVDDAAKLFGTASIEPSDDRLIVDLPAYGYCWVRIDADLN